ncbi:hypothetical protein DICA1_C05204 [Diutina catenulata]
MNDVAYDFAELKTALAGLGDFNVEAFTVSGFCDHLKMPDDGRSNEEYCHPESVEECSQSAGDTHNSSGSPKFTVTWRLDEPLPISGAMAMVALTMVMAMAIFQVNDSVESFSILRCVVTCSLCSGFCPN